MILVIVPNCNASQSSATELRGGMSAVEFRKHAAEHLDWAKTAKSDRRQTFQQMAQAWLEAAARWESALSADTRCKHSAPDVRRRDDSRARRNAAQNGSPSFAALRISMGPSDFQNPE